MSAWTALFGWPNGSTIGNFVDDAVMFALGIIVGHFLAKWFRREIGKLHSKLDEHHEALKAHITATAATAAPTGSGIPISTIEAVAGTGWRKEQPAWTEQQLHEFQAIWDRLFNGAPIDPILERIKFDPHPVNLDVPRLEPIPWPTGLAPKPMKPALSPDSPLPKCDVLIVTYTTAEGQALADVLTPGVQSSQWVKYTNGWPAIKKLIEGNRAPSLYSECSAIYWVTTIGDKTVIVMKSDLHPATDGPNLPIVAAWRQWISQCQPSLVITTGTAGAVGSGTQLGDVVIADSIKWDCEKQFAKQPFARTSYTPTATRGIWTGGLAPLLEPNFAKLPVDLLTENRGPMVWRDGSSTVTTDFFAMGDTTDSYGLLKADSSCRMVEMDDAALGLALCGPNNMTPATVSWASVRNGSDPVMDGSLPLSEQSKQASAIYEKWGYTTSIGSAITCWALVAGLGA